MITLHKLLPLLVSPLLIFAVVMLLAVVFKKRLLGLIALVIFLVASLPPVADRLWQGLEGGAVKASAQHAPTADAIVVLGGVTSLAPGPTGAQYEWGEAADRFWSGIELFRAKRAAKIVFASARLPWTPDDLETEGQWLKSEALKAGVPASAILLTSEVQNTAQEAAAVAKIFPSGRVLLVTSAFHMPRAQALFEKEGLRVTPFPVDFRASQNKPTAMDYIPSADALDKTTAGLREFLGRAYYAVFR